MIDSCRWVEASDGWPRPRGPLRLVAEPPRASLPGETSRHLGELYIRQFVDLADLTPDQAVLEPGCGTGRMAEPLTRYLTATGSYEGFDVMAEAVEWCQENIASSHPNFHFRHVDVLDRAYNPNGNLSPTEFEFPYEREAFDFVFLTSVFTHMLPPEVRRYMSEVRRVLRPSGRCLMTFFLLNEESIEATRSGARRDDSLAGATDTSTTSARARRRRLPIPRRHY